MWKYFFIVLLILIGFFSLSQSVRADSNPTYSCVHNGATAADTQWTGGQPGNEYEDQNGNGPWWCDATAICDDNYSDAGGYPCAEFSQIKCSCTGTSTFSCGINSSNEFSRTCGFGEVCDMTAFKAGSNWPCSSTGNPSIEPTTTALNPCPNGICSTAIGDINVTSPSGFIEKIFRILLSLSGVIALILIIVSGYQLSLSQGNPEKVKNARERLTAAIIGLMFIIFSVAILQIIGFDILHLPGFNK